MRININLCITAIKVAHYFKYIWCRVMVMCVVHFLCYNRMLHITSFTLNSYHINSISKWLRHMYSIMAQQYQIPGLMAIIFSQFIFVLFLPTHIRSLFSVWKSLRCHFHVYIFLCYMHISHEIEVKFYSETEIKGLNLSQFDIGRFKSYVYQRKFIFFSVRLACWWTSNI